MLQPAQKPSSPTDPIVPRTCATKPRAPYAFRDMAQAEEAHFFQRPEPTAQQPCPAVFVSGFAPV